MFYRKFEDVGRNRKSLFCNFYKRKGKKKQKKKHLLTITRLEVLTVKRNVFLELEHNAIKKCHKHNYFNVDAKSQDFHLTT